MILLICLCFFTRVTNAFEGCESVRDRTPEYAILSARPMRTLEVPNFQYNMLSAFDNDFKKMADHFLGIKTVKAEKIKGKWLSQASQDIKRSAYLKRLDDRDVVRRALVKDLVRLYLGESSDEDFNTLFITQSIQQKGKAIFIFQDFGEEIKNELEAIKTYHHKDEDSNTTGPIRELIEEMKEFLGSDQVTQLKNNPFRNMSQSEKTQILSDNLTKLHCRIRDAHKNVNFEETNHHLLILVQFEYLIDKLISLSIDPSNSFVNSEWLLDYKEGLEYLMRTLNVSLLNREYKYEDSKKKLVSFKPIDFWADQYQAFMQSIGDRIASVDDDSSFWKIFSEVMHFNAHHLIQHTLQDYIAKNLNDQDSDPSQLSNSENLNYGVLFAFVLSKPDRNLTVKPVYLQLLRSILKDKKTKESKFYKKLILNEDMLVKKITYILILVVLNDDTLDFMKTCFELLLHDQQSKDPQFIFDEMIQIYMKKDKTQWNYFFKVAQIVFSHTSNDKKIEKLRELKDDLTTVVPTSILWKTLLKDFKLNKIGLEKSIFESNYGKLKIRRLLRI